MGEAKGKWDIMNCRLSRGRWLQSQANPIDFD